MNKKIFFIALACAIQLFSCMACAQTAIESSENSVSILKSEPGEDEIMSVESKKNPETQENAPPMVIYPEIALPLNNYGPGAPPYPYPEGKPHPRPQRR